MTNTLTWDIKPIALPKINANLLSVISLILLLTMAFMTLAVMAICEAEKEAAYAARAAAENALEEFKKAGDRLITAEILLAAALATRIPFLIKRAWDYFRGCLIALGTARENFRQAMTTLKDAIDKWEACLNSHGVDSGDCDSGSNNV